MEGLRHHLWTWFARAFFWVLFLTACWSVLWPLNDHEDPWVASERAFGTTLNDLTYCQILFTEDYGVDSDGDGCPEFGTLRELLEVRGEGLSRILYEYDAVSDEAMVFGRYILKVYVPHDSELAEKCWCFAIWPLKRGRGSIDGTRIYCYSDLGPGLRFSGSTKDSKYWGWAHGPGLSDIFSGAPFIGPLKRDQWVREF
jgi:hypothetical protein